jgi:hypothetical protein
MREGEIVEERLRLYFLVQAVVDVEVENLFKATSNEIYETYKNKPKRPKILKKKLKVIEVIADLAIRTMSDDQDNDETITLFEAIDKYKNGLNKRLKSANNEQSLSYSIYHFFMNQNSFGVTLLLYALLCDKKNDDLMYSLLDNENESIELKLSSMINKSIGHHRKIDSLSKLRNKKNTKRIIKIKSLSIPEYSKVRKLYGYKNDLERSLLLLDSKFFKFASIDVLKKVATLIVQEKWHDILGDLIILRYQYPTFHTDYGIKIELGKENHSLCYSFCVGKKIHREELACGF